MIDVTLDALEKELEENLYFADQGLTTAIYLSIKMGKPLLLEGEAGVGKTEAAKTLAKALGADLVRLQCYEGLGINEALYEWNYSKQILHIRLNEAQQEKLTDEDLFSEKFLLERPILTAIRNPNKTVLLIDEIDRSELEFEAFLLETLSESQITIPEIGTIKAQQKPIVILTSNRTRELHDALKRRCLYHWIDYPAPEKEVQIIRSKTSGIKEKLVKDIVTILGRLRERELFKPPGVAEGLDWALALLSLGEEDISLENLDKTIGVLLKTQEDIQMVNQDVRKELITAIE